MALAGGDAEKRTEAFQLVFDALAKADAKKFDAHQPVFIKTEGERVNDSLWRFKYTHPLWVHDGDSIQMTLEFTENRAVETLEVHTTGYDNK